MIELLLAALMVAAIIAGPVVFLVWLDWRTARSDEWGV